VVHSAGELGGGNEVVTGIVKDRALRIIGSAVIPVVFTGLDQQTATCRMRFRIFAKGESSWKGLIIGGPSLDVAPAGLGFQAHRGGHWFDALSLMVPRCEQEFVARQLSNHYDDHDDDEWTELGTQGVDPRRKSHSQAESTASGGSSERADRDASSVDFVNLRRIRGRSQMDRGNSDDENSRHDSENGLERQHWSIDGSIWRLQPQGSTGDTSQAEESDSVTSKDSSANLGPILDLILDEGGEGGSGESYLTHPEFSKKLQSHPKPGHG